MPRTTARHGTMTRAITGCACGPCQSKAREGYYATPRKPKPPITRRLGKAVVTVDSSMDLDVLELESERRIDGAGNMTVAVTGRCHPETWDELTSSDSQITKAQDAVSEVVKNVPVTKKVHVDPSRYRKGGNGKDSATVVSSDVKPVELPVLVAQISVLATGLVTGETDLTVALKQYGRLRDEIARRRNEFAQAEGAFEALQAAITKKVSE